LERRGLVEQAADPDDRRRRLVTLTAEGRSVLARAVPVWERTHAEIDRLLADGSAKNLRQDLRALAT
jgi:DNA-binding MarR family transcriptional regulator